MTVQEVAFHANMAEATVRYWIKKRWLIAWKTPGGSIGVADLL